MITTTGKDILAKYLVGTVAKFGTHIAVGCGPKPATDISVSVGQFSSYNKLDFELFRSEIVSRGYVKNSSGQLEMVLTAEVPNAEPALMTEVGLYNGDSSKTQVDQASVRLYSFSPETESWSDLTLVSPITISTVGDNLATNTPGLISATTDSMFYVKNDNQFFSRIVTSRTYQQPRIGQYSLMVKGNNTSGISSSGVNLNINGSTDNDLIKVALCIIDSSSSSRTSPLPDIEVKGHSLTLQFVTNTGETATATIKHNASSDSMSGRTTETPSTTQPYTLRNASDNSTNRYDYNRYIIDVFPKGSFTYTSGFAWSNARQIKIFPNVFTDTTNSTPTANAFICLDGIRFDNVKSYTPVEGLLGYSLISATPISGVLVPAPANKRKDNTSLIEFRFGVDLA